MLIGALTFVILNSIGDQSRFVSLRNMPIALDRLVSARQAGVLDSTCRSTTVRISSSRLLAPRTRLVWGR